MLSLYEYEFVLENWKMLHSMIETNRASTSEHCSLLDEKAIPLEISTQPVPARLWFPGYATSAANARTGTARGFDTRLSRVHNETEPDLIAVEHVSP